MVELAATVVEEPAARVELEKILTRQEAEEAARAEADWLAEWNLN